jgi:hypothetical protein
MAMWTFTRYNEYSMYIKGIRKKKRILDIKRGDFIWRHYEKQFYIGNVVAEIIRLFKTLKIKRLYNMW